MDEPQEMSLLNSQILEHFEWMLWYHNLQLQKYQDRRVLPYEMFPVLKDLEEESVTWERLFLFDLFMKKKRN